MGVVLAVNRKLVVLVLLISAAILLWFFMKPVRSSLNVKPGEYPVHKHHKLRYKLINMSGETIKDVTFSTLIPYRILANQKLVNIVTDRAYVEETDKQGNTYYHYKIDTISPYQSIFIDLKVNIDMSLSAQSINSHSANSYLSASTYIESDAEGIKALAEQLKKQTDIDTLKSAYEWINRNLEYTGYIKQEHGALYALQHKSGDCTEYANLMVALARASGIPARVMDGYVYSENSVVYARDYHNWVEVFVDNQWHIVDPQKQRFMEKYSEYLAFGILHAESADFKNPRQIGISDKRVNVVL